MNIRHALFFGLVIMASQSYAGDPVAGKAASMACAACHGAAGVSANPMWPNIAGQKEAYLKKQLKAFKDGTRKDPLMGSVAKALSDENIDNLAAYYGGL